MSTAAAVDKQRVQRNSSACIYSQHTLETLQFTLKWYTAQARSLYSELTASEVYMHTYEAVYDKQCLILLVSVRMLYMCVTLIIIVQNLSWRG
jgi:hypothetical protein